MKTWEEITNCLRLELVAAFPRMCRNPEIPLYLYYIASTPEHDSGLVICAEQPANQEYKLANPQPISIGLTIDQNYQRIIIERWLDRLHIIDQPKAA